MNRQKLKALVFGDYFFNIAFSALGFLALSWIFRFSWGYFAHGVVFTVSMFLFMYSKGALAAKIDLREKKTPMANALKLVLPLVITLVSIIFVYSLIYFDVIPIGDIVVKTIVADDKSAVLTIKDTASLIVKVLFLNITGFLKETPTSPFLLLLSPLVVLAGSFSGYYFGRKKVYILDVLTKIKDSIAKKFNE